MKAKLVVATILVCIDQLSKLIFYHTSVLNRGGVFGVAQGFWWELLMVPPLFYLIYIWSKEKNKFHYMGLTLLVAGGMGNIIDRLRWGGVVDFIRYPILGFTGNLADIYLTLAVILIFYETIRQSHDKNK